MASEKQTPRVAYRGFISYSHQNSGIAKAIHRKLEGYRLPSRIAGSETEMGTVPKRLTPIFRDREELSAGESLSVQVQDALTSSDCLIVLCSPESAASKWVAQEIDIFRALHPTRPVLAALISGEPEEAFPPPLTADGLEPIAADFRANGDGPRLALVKLVAGMTGVKLDALIQRDHQRQLRRVMAITFSAVVALLVTGLLLLAANRARTEAQHQRQQAEGLVEYMLTDLRDRLKGVGRLDVMTAVNERAMGYYGAQESLADLPLESLNRRARVLHAMGEDDEKRGHLALALDKFGEAQRTTAAILAKRPNDVNAIYAHAQSEYWLGDAHFRKAYESPQTKSADLDYRRSEVHFLKYRDLAYRLLKSEPRRLEWVKEAGYAEGNLCSIALEKPATSGNAVDFCSKATAQMEEWLVRAPKDTSAMSALANRLSWQATALDAAGNQNEAIARRERQFSLLRRAVSQEPNSAELQQDLMLAELLYAKQQFDRGLFADAQSHADNALKISTSLQRFDPENDQWKAWRLQITDLREQMKGKN